MEVADARGRKWDAAAGIGFAIVTLVALLLPGTPPKAEDSVDKITSYLSDGRDEILAGNFLIGIAALLFIWFLGSLRSYLRAGEGGEGRLSAAAFGGGIAGIVLILLGAGILNAVTFDLVKADASPELVRATFDASGAFFAMAGFCFAAMLAAASCSGARSGALPSWLYWSGSVIALLQVVAGTALFVTSGPLQSGGAITGYAAPTLAFVWIVAVSIVIMNREGLPPVARTEP